MTNNHRVEILGSTELSSSAEAKGVWYNIVNVMKYGPFNV